MSSALDVGLGELENHLGWGTADQAIERVDVDRRGAIVFTVQGEGGTRWFHLVDGECTELTPGDDARLPLCRDLYVREGADPRVLSWRPGRRIALGIEAGGRKAVAKGYRRGRSNRAARLHEKAAGAPAGSGAFRVPLLLDWNEGTESIRMELLSGASPALDAANAKAFYRVGYALRHFQDQVPVDDLGEHDSRAELAVLEDLGRRVEAAAGVPKHWEPAFAALKAHSLPAPTGASCAVHRDLHDGQLLFDGRTVGLIDFDLLCAGDAALDVANLTAHLRLRALQGIRGADDAGAEACSRAFLEGADHGAGFDLSSLRFYQATTFLRLALIYTLRPRWRDLSAPLIDLARKCTDELSAV